MFLLRLIFLLISIFLCVRVIIKSDEDSNIHRHMWTPLVSEFFALFYMMHTRTYVCSCTVKWKDSFAFGFDFYRTLWFCLCWIMYLFYYYYWDDDSVREEIHRYNTIIKLVHSTQTRSLIRFVWCREWRRRVKESGINYARNFIFCHCLSLFCGDKCLLGYCTIYWWYDHLL